MKMKLLPPLAVLLVLTAAAWAPVQGAQAIPDLGQVKEIILHGQEGILLKIFQNGSGDLVYGANGESSTKIPQQTFSFENIYRTLSPDLINAENDAKSIGLPSPGSHYGSLYRFYSKEQDIMYKVLAQAGIRMVKASG